VAVFGEEVVGEAQARASVRALEVYKDNVGGVLRRPRPEHIANTVGKAVTEEVVAVLEQSVAALVKSLEQVSRPDPAPVETDREAEAEDKGYVGGLKRAWLIVENLEGKPGKRMIAERLHKELRKAGKAEQQ
jgi:hypothetical protein